jgi:hypothetical protein
MNKRVIAISGLVAILSGTPISNTYAAPGPTQKDLDNAAMDAKNWLSADRDYCGQRYSALNPANSRATCASLTAAMEKFCTRITSVVRRSVGQVVPLNVVDPHPSQ